MTTDRTDERSETAHGTARPPNSESREQVIAELCEALVETRIDLSILRSNVRDAMIRDHRWEGMPEKIGEWIDRISAALAKARGAAG